VNEPVTQLLATEWSDIDALCRHLDESEWDAMSDCPGGSVRDLVSHMIGTERMLSGDSAPQGPATLGAHVANPIGEANEAWVDARRSLPGAEVLAEFREITSRRLEQLQAMSDEDFDRVGFTPEGEGPYRTFMDIRLFDCWIHEQDIRRALGQPGHLDGPIAERSVAKVAASAGYVVGKKAATPEGSTVVFDVHGPTSIVVPVVVEGRARVLDEAPADPTVTLHLDTTTYVALGCGRWDLARALADGDVRIEGDEDLGRRVLDNMSFTI
jgi:uncharacterized protein (TIGR03083 family)